MLRQGDAAGGASVGGHWRWAAHHLWAGLDRTGGALAEVWGSANNYMYTWYSTGTCSGHNDSTWVYFHLLWYELYNYTMYREGLRSRRSLGRAMPSSDEKRQAQQVARRLKARQLKIQTLLEKLPGARQPATTIARPTPRDYSPPAALTLVPFRQSLT